MRLASNQTDNWRDQILKQFSPNVSRLTLVADPDALLLEEKLLDAILERGFGFLMFDDPVAFRFAYEVGFRSQLGCDEVHDLVVVLQGRRHELATLPHDLLQVGRQLSFGLEDLFPNLSYPVVAALDKSDIDALYQARMEIGFNRLGDDETKNFALLHIFGISPALIKNSTDLLHVLLRKHYRRHRLPLLLERHLIQSLRQNTAFGTWPLEVIVPDREAFLSFLQEHWPPFLDRIAKCTDVQLENMNQSSGRRMIEDSDVLPFDHDDVRVYIDNLFVDGMLSPVPHQSSNVLQDKWVAVGISINREHDTARRFDSLIDIVAKTIPDPGARHYDWTEFAYRWAELSLRWSDTTAGVRSVRQNKMDSLRRDVDMAFRSWIDSRYAGLHDQPPVPPVMVHHLPRFLERQLSEVDRKKIGLVVVDGLALDQWIALRMVLTNRQPHFRFREDAVFAWVPTITSVSRQAIFAGAPPLYFPSSLWSTDRESSLWTRFWTDQDLGTHEIGYAKGLGDGRMDNVFDLLSQPKLRVIGLVVDKVDKIMHGMELGAAGMYNQVRLWADEGFMERLLNILLDRGFTIFLTSDHGNIEAKGIGRPSDQGLADMRGERMRIYSDSVLRSRVHDRFSDSIVWPALGLPKDCFPLLAPNRSAFVSEGKRIVCHGGASLEEVIVPMVQVERILS